MLETAPRAFAAFFASIGPVGAAIPFATFCPRFSWAERIAVSLKAAGIAAPGAAFLAARFDKAFCAGERELETA